MAWCILESFWYHVLMGPLIQGWQSGTMPGRGRSLLMLETALQHQPRYRQFQDGGNCQTIFLGPHILKHSLGKVGVTKLNFKIV